MGRFTQPRAKVCRRLGLNIFNNSNVEKAYLKREEVVKFGRSKQSALGVRLIEKQKIMYYYGMREKQMRKFFDRARRLKGNTGTNFLVLCERRLDNALFSAGFAASRAQARQLIAHGHIKLNGKKCDIPSASVNTGDDLSVKENAKTQKLIDAALHERSGYNPPEWLVADSQTRTARVVRLPLRDDVMLSVNDQLVIEYYSR